MLPNYEKLGLFYLGRACDPATGQATAEPLLYDAKDLTTHAVCVGMTGSGKTGLGIALLEEAAIDGIPALVIDPKGDLGNLALTFPQLRPDDFRPWVDPSEGVRKGLSPEAFAQQIAEAWRRGLAQWDQGPDRIERLRAAAEVVIYTPGSDAGRPLCVLKSFDPPAPAQVADANALREQVMATVSGLLGLLGIAADPLRSREHILLSTLLDQAWRQGRGMDLPALIAAIQRPPFQTVGVFDLDTFFPAAARLELAMALNNLLAAPGFAAWMQGEPLDIERLLFTPAGKPRLAVLSIAHLSEAERMFFVTLLLNAVVAWMRRQAGTSSLRALLYMDEIFGYFPPTATPPSKLPMLTLLKQARAYGLGVVLATQNPVDLDYKGLSNTGTWFIGRLQTERDKLRVLDGLEGALAAAPGGFDRQATERMLAGLASRVFLMRNVHEDKPVLFQSRWALSYLSGPMTPAQLRTLRTEGASDTPEAGAAATSPAPPAPVVPAGQPPPTPVAGSRPPLPPAIAERFVPTRPGITGSIQWRPCLLGVAKLHFVETKSGFDAWQLTSYLTPLPAADSVEPWAAAVVAADVAVQLPDRAPADAVNFAPLPSEASRERSYAAWGKALEAHIYQHAVCTRHACTALKLASQAGESEGSFRASVALALRERRDQEVERLRQRYAPRLTTAREQLRRADERIDREKSQLGQQKMQTAVSVGATILSALFGRRTFSVGNVGRASTAMRGAGRVAREKEDVGRAEEGLETVQQRLQALEQELEQQVAVLQDRYDPAAVEIATQSLRPRKSDITVATIALAWAPYVTTPGGDVAAYDWPVSER